MIRAGTLRHRVTLQKRVYTRDPDTGEKLLGWEDVAKVYASISDSSAKELMVAQAAQSEVTGRIVIRYRSGVDASMRILYRNQVFNIQGVQHDLVSGIEYLTLPYSRGTNDGPG